MGTMTKIWQNSLIILIRKLVITEKEETIAVIYFVKHPYSKKEMLVLISPLSKYFLDIMFQISITYSRHIQ